MIVSTDPVRPLDGNYADLNYVPWYAAAPFAERLQYLDMMIGRYEAEITAWKQSHPNADAIQQMLDRDLGRIYRKMEPLQIRRTIELADREPLNTVCYGSWLNGKPHNEYRPLPPRSPYQLYRSHLDSPRWRRIRTRKLVSVNGHCEYPGCTAIAAECHHRHYSNVGFEENTDLEALCRDHHEARHRQAPGLAAEVHLIAHEIAP
jgi:hypothetical protein